MAGQRKKKRGSLLTPEIYKLTVAADLLSTSLKLAAVVAVAWLVNDSIHALAAETTVANIGVRFLADIRGGQLFAWLTGAGGVAWGYGERYLRIKTAKRQGRHIEELEQRLDPDRSSSGYEGG